MMRSHISEIDVFFYTIMGNMRMREFYVIFINAYCEDLYEVLKMPKPVQM